MITNQISIDPPFLFYSLGIEIKKTDSIINIIDVKVAMVSQIPLLHKLRDDCISSVLKLHPVMERRKFGP
jgi:hypothetical protein